MGDDFVFLPPFCPPSAAASAGDDLSDFDRHHHRTPFFPLFDEQLDYFDEDDHPPLTLDLFHHRLTLPPLVSTVSPEEPRSSSHLHAFACSDSPIDVLGLRFDCEEEEEHERLERNADRGSLDFDSMSEDNFRGRTISPSGSVEFPMNSQADFEWLPVVEFDSDSDSDSDGHIHGLGDDQKVGTGTSSVMDEDPFCSDLDERWRHTNGDFELEEIFRQTEEMNAPGFTFAMNEESSGVIGESMDVLSEIDDFFPASMIEYVEPYYFDDHDFEIFSMLFWRFTEHDSNFWGGPPTSKSVIDNLPSVVLSKEDFVNNHATCAVCRDGILVEQEVKKLPCSHHYHEECILPWLRICNTCPLCRFELPTYDP